MSAFGMMSSCSADAENDGDIAVKMGFFLAPSQDIIAHASLPGEAQGEGEDRLALDLLHRRAAQLLGPLGPGRHVPIGPESKPDPQRQGEAQGQGQAHVGWGRERPCVTRARGVAERRGGPL